MSYEKNAQTTLPEGAHVRPCPLCGERPHWGYTRRPNGYAGLTDTPQIGCPDCDIWERGDTRLAAIRNWNQGVGWEQPKPRARARRLSPSYEKCYKPPEGAPSLSRDAVLLGLQSLVGDRESFITEDEPDSQFVHDKRVLEDAIRMILHLGYKTPAYDPTTDPYAYPRQAGGTV